MRPLDVKGFNFHVMVKTVTIMGHLEIQFEYRAIVLGSELVDI